MAGRAGRPKYDEKGEAVLIARTADEQDFLMQNYVFAKPERIWSKLAIERILRSHVLAAIASGYVHSEQGLFEFFGKAFYAHQYDLRNIEKLVSNILQFLYKEEIVIVEGTYLRPTEFGRRLSELYIDPVSGALIRDGLYNRAKRVTDLSFLHLVCHTPDISPKFYPRRKEAEELGTYMHEHEDEFLFDLPEEYDDITAYEEFLAEIKCAKVAEDWIDEGSEDQIIERYSVEPGDLFRFVESTKWLTHAVHELATLFGHKDLLPPLSKLMERVKYGVKSELLPLVKLEGIGRMRGRTLYSAGLINIKVLQQASLSKLASVPLIGPQTARRIKEQVGGTVSREEWEGLKGKSWKQKKLLSE
jgi:helicase